MLPALLASASLTAPEAAPTIGSIRSLSPQAIGHVVLRGRDHGIVEKVEPPAVRALEPPGFVILELTERSIAIANGCVRRRWTATFSRPPGAAESAAIFHDAYAATQVALRSASTCSDGKFAHVNPGLSIEEALSALRHLRQVSSGKAKVRFSCSDSTGSSLCRSPKMIERELARLTAWAVTKRDGKIEFWLGKGEQAVTAVTYSETSLDQVTVERRVPPPA